MLRALIDSIHMCRFENKKTMPPVMKPGNEFLPIFSDSFAKSFRLEIDRIKVHPNLFAHNGICGPNNVAVRNGCGYIV